MVSIMVLAMVFGTFVVASAGETSGETSVETSGETSNLNEYYNLMKAGNGDLFTNYVDGYTILVDQGMLVDMSKNRVGAFLESPHKTIEIYKENRASSFESYNRYSNGFLKNTFDHTLLVKETQVIGNYTVFVTAWQRAKLARVDMDKNYYVVLDFISGTDIFTIVIKTDEPIENMGGYQKLIENFSPFNGYKQGKNHPTQDIDLDLRGWNEETQAFYQRIFRAEEGMSWGLYEPNTNYTKGSEYYDYNQITWYEDQFKYTFPVIVNYSEFDNTVKHPNLEKRLNQAWENEKVLELTLQTNNSTQGNMVYRVLQGEYDEFLNNYAKTISDFDHPVIFRLGNEMNGDWCPYSGYNTSRDAQVFVNFYKYIYQVFSDQGVDNVIWVWNPNDKSFPDFKWNDAYNYYPGDEYVDVVGMTAYNTGTYYSRVGEKWLTFQELYQKTYNEYSEHFGQALMITEFASASMGGSKSQWVRDMFTQIPAYSKIKLAIWWDGCDYNGKEIARNYTMRETQEVLDTFIDFFDPPWYINAFA